MCFKLCIHVKICRCYICIFVLAVFCSVYSMRLILECKKHATSNHSEEDQRKFTYSDIGRTAFGTVGKLAVDFVVLFCNLGVSASYIVFISSNLQVRQADYYNTSIYSDISFYVNIASHSYLSYLVRCFE